MRLIVLDIVASVLLGIVFSFTVGTQLLPWFGSRTLNYYLFLVLLVGKVVATTYIVLQWLNEYYEITREKVIHRRGLLYKNEDTFSLKQVREIKMNQGFIGRVTELRHHYARGYPVE